METKTNILVFKKEDIHTEEMTRLKELYDMGHISKLDAIVNFLNHLERTTGVRPSPKTYIYRRNWKKVS